MQCRNGNENCNTVKLSRPSVKHYRKFERGKLETMRSWLYLPESVDKVRDCYYLLWWSSAVVMVVQSGQGMRWMIGGFARTLSPMNWIEKIVKQCHQHRGNSSDDEISGFYLLFSFNFELKLNRYMESFKSHTNKATNRSPQLCNWNELTISNLIYHAPMFLQLLVF